MTGRRETQEFARAQFFLRVGIPSPIESGAQRRMMQRRRRRRRRRRAALERVRTVEPRARGLEPCSRRLRLPEGSSSRRQVFRRPVDGHRRATPASSAAPSPMSDSTPSRQRGESRPARHSAAARGQQRLRRPGAADTRNTKLCFSFFSSPLEVSPFGKKVKVCGSPPCNPRLSTTAGSRCGTPCCKGARSQWPRSPSG